MAVIDACARLLPGVLGNEASAEHESHSEALGGLLEYPQYTRPVEFRGARRARGAPGRQPRRDRRLAPRRGRAPHARAPPRSLGRRGDRGRPAPRGAAREPPRARARAPPGARRAGRRRDDRDHEPRRPRPRAQRAHLRRGGALRRPPDRGAAPARRAHPRALGRGLGQAAHPGPRGGARAAPRGALARATRIAALGGRAAIEVWTTAASARGAAPRPRTRTRGRGSRRRRGRC